MSESKLSIIHSPEAEAFLRTVTKGFYDRSPTGLWMYEVIGQEWDELRQWSEGMRTEIHPQTCTWSIAVWEWVYGFEPDESMTLEERRRRILSRVIGAKPINPEVIRRGITALSGINSKVTDFVGPYAFSITLYPDIESMPDEAIPDIRIERYIQAVKPAHLRVNIEINVHREFRYDLSVSHGGAIGIFFRCQPGGGNRKFVWELPVSHGGYLHSTAAGVPPDTPRIIRGRQGGAGGAYTRTHIKSRRID